MNHPSARFAALLVTVGFLGAGQVRADYTNWSYQWSMQPSSVISSGTGSVTYAINSKSEPGASSIPVASVSSTSTATGTASDSYSAPYSLTMKITDGNGQSGTLTYNGNLSGAVNAGQSSLMNTISNPNETLTLDGHTYNVDLQLQPSNGSVGAPGTAASTISAVVTVDGSTTTTPPPSTGGSGGTTPASAPEPSALVLAGMACSACGLGGWLRRMRPRIVAA